MVRWNVAGPSRQMPDGIRSTSWVLHDYLCSTGFSDSGKYDWYVEVRQQRGAEPSLSDPVRCRSETWSFVWTGCAVTPTPEPTPCRASSINAIGMCVVLPQSGHCDELGLEWNGGLMSAIFEPGRIGLLETKNRLMRSPTCEWMCDANGKAGQL